MALATSVLHDGHVAVLALDGELDLAEVGVLEAAFARCLEHGATHVVVDATDLAFCDSSGLAALLRQARRLGPGRLLTAGVHGVVTRLVEVTGTAAALGVRPDVRTALGEAHSATQASGARDR